MTAVAFSADGRYLVTGSGGEEIVRVWYVETGQELRQLPGYAGFINGLSVSADSEQVLTADMETTSQLWELETDRSLTRFSGNNSMFSLDGKYIVTGGENRTYLWDRITGQRLRAFGGADGMWSVALSPDGQKILIGGSNNLAQLWDTDLQTLIDSVCGRALRDFSEEERLACGLDDMEPTCAISDQAS